MKEITGDAFFIPRLEQGHKKSSTDKSEELELYENRRNGVIRKLLRLTYLSRLLRMELAPAFPMPREEVAKASQGHDPLPFLISNCKELVQR